MLKSSLLGAALAALVVSSSVAAEIKVLTAGAFKPIVLALVPGFEARTGHKVVLENDTAGALAKRIEGGERFDVAILSSGLVRDFSGRGLVAPDGHREVARVGIGVVVMAGTPAPDVSSVDAFRAAVLAAPSVAYIDPASGGSSGIYLAGLFDKLGIAREVAAKAVLVPGGIVADRLVRGEAVLGIHQISEIVPVKGVRLVGPLPAAIQNYTTYAVGVGPKTAVPDAARALVEALTGPEAAAILAEKGMEAVT